MWRLALLSLALSLEKMKQKTSYNAQRQIVGSTDVNNEFGPRTSQSMEGAKWMAHLLGTVFSSLSLLFCFLRKCVSEKYTHLKKTKCDDSCLLHEMEPCERICWNGRELRLTPPECKEYPPCPDPCHSDSSRDCTRKPYLRCCEGWSLGEPLHSPSRCLFGNSCKYMPDGYYYRCLECETLVHCVSEIVGDSLTCPEGTVYDIFHPSHTAMVGLSEDACQDSTEGCGVDCVG